MSYENCPLSLASPKAIAIAPDLTYGELDLLASRAAASLKLKRGDLIAIPAEASWRTIALLFAAWRLSINVALIPLNLPAPAKTAHLAPLSPHLIVDDPFAGTCISSEKQLELQPPALMLLTSGSSGKPKWASFSLFQLFESARTVAATFHAKRGNLWLASIPLHHVAGIGVMLRALLSEGTLIFEEKSLPPAERILRVNADFASLVPTQLYRLLRQRLPPLKTHFLIGGAPLAESLYRAAILQGLRLSLTYGLTEMSSTVLLSTTPQWKGAFAYLGEPLINRQLQLSQYGELLVSGTSLFNGYGFPAALPPSPFPTGDLGCYDERLGWSVQGRKDFQFQSGGDNIQPEEIEAALLSHRDVEEAIVVPKPDEEFGARPAAFVRTSLSSSDLALYLSERLPKYKIPVVFEKLEEQSGFKPNRKELAARYGLANSFFQPI